MIFKDSAVKIYIALVATLWLVLVVKMIFY